MSIDADALVNRILTGPSRPASEQEHAGAARILKRIFTPAAIKKATDEAERDRIEERKHLLATLEAHDREAETAGHAAQQRHAAAEARVKALESELTEARGELLAAVSAWSASGSRAERQRNEITKRLGATAHPGITELIVEVNRRVARQRIAGVRTGLEKPWIGPARVVSDFEIVEQRMNAWRALIDAAQALKISTADESASLEELRSRLAKIGEASS